MLAARAFHDIDACREIWRRAIPEETVWDLWEVREIFHRHFLRPLLVLLVEDSAAIRGFLPLSWIEETGSYGYFPGETWRGTTWIEQNRVVADSQEVLGALIDAIPAPYHLRYLRPLAAPTGNPPPIDETGYLFRPASYGYDMANYFREFSGKSARRLRRDLAAIEDLGLSVRHDSPDDFDAVVRLNLDRMGDASYFADARFRESFRDLAVFLRQRGWLRTTALLAGGETAAVDIGCIYRNTYTLLAGGTNAAFPGIAKAINVHHMRYACDRRFDCADFLCGDFSWKTLFHLAPRPLYLISNASIPDPHATAHGAPGDPVECAADGR